MCFRLGLASVSRPGGVDSLHRCITVWGEWSDTESDNKPKLQMSGRMDQSVVVFFQDCGRTFERMQEFGSLLQMPSASESQIRSWLGVAK